MILSWSKLKSQYKGVSSFQETIPGQKKEQHVLFAWVQTDVVQKHLTRLMEDKGRLGRVKQKAYGTQAKER